MKFAVKTKSVIPSRTSDETTKFIKAKNLDEAWEKTRNEREVKWGFREIVSVKEAN